MNKSTQKLLPGQRSFRGGILRRQPQGKSIMNENTPQLFVVHGRAYASSLDVAIHFRRLHKDVLRDIRGLVAESPAAFSRRNFALTTYEKRGKQYPTYNLTRDAFALLAMSFTGSEVLEWKIAYITAFNRMESERRRQQARDGFISQLSLFPALQAAVGSQRPVYDLNFAIGVLCYTNLNIPPVTREHLVSLIKRGVLNGTRQEGRWVVYQDSFNHWLEQRRAA